MKKIKTFIQFIKDPNNALYMLEKVCFTFGILSIFFSLALMGIFGSESDLQAGQNQRLAIFVGLWAPTLIGIANYLKKR